jgi:hypothetical protein
MDYLVDILADFQNRLKNIATIEGINANLIKIFDSNLNTIRQDIEQTGRFGGLLKKIDRQIETLKTVEHLPEMASNFETLREQSIVLMVGAFEVFVGDLFKAIANNDPDYFVWPEKDKKISIDIESFSANFTLGDAIITHLGNKQYSFQDLGSTIKAVSDYLGVAIEVDNSMKDSIAFGTACRHLIVHRGSKVDRQFLHQIRDVRSVTYTEGERLKLKDNDVTRLQTSIEGFSEYLVQTLIQRDVI